MKADSQKRLRDATSRALRDPEMSKAACVERGDPMGRKPRYHGRREPYTAIGIKRMTCYREGCDNRAVASFTICANGRRSVPVCADCDREINRVVMEFMGFDNAVELLAAYKGADQ